MMATVLEDKSIKTSASDTSKFYQICHIVMQAIGLNIDPKGSIKSYLRRQGN
jgi:hypothetical protein